MTLRIVECSGSHRDFGRSHGEAMRDSVSANVSLFEEYFTKRGSEMHEVVDAACDWMTYLNNAAPDYVEEMRGISEGANLHIRSVAMLNARHEIGYGLLAKQAATLSMPLLDGCTSAGLLPDSVSGGATLLAQTLDGLGGLRGSIFAGKRTSSDGLSSFALYEAGSAGPSAGLNSNGIGFVYNTLLTSADGRVPKSDPFRLRCKMILESKSFDGAIKAIVQKDRFTSINYLIGHAIGEVINIETSPNMRRYLYPEQGIVTHANHFEPGSPATSEWERFVPDTLFRSRRFDRHLRRQNGDITIDYILDGLKDHFSFPASICLHPDHSTAGGRSASTLSAVILDLTNGTMTATDGPPCEAEPQTFYLNA